MVGDRKDRPNPGELTHLDPHGGVQMVDIGVKNVTPREALARGFVRMKQATFDLIAQGDMPKGDVLGTAQLAGIMAAKRTADLIPLCHPLGLSGVNLKVDLDPQGAGGPGVRVEASVRVEAKTGAEMEALTAVAVACLAVYDMCKAVDKELLITDIRLVRKSGGKSGLFIREGEGSGQNHLSVSEQAQGDQENGQGRSGVRTGARTSRGCPRR